MALRWSALVALALLALLLCTPVQAEEGWDGSFGRATGATATGAFDVHGDQLVWASQNGQRVELLLTDLDSLESRILTYVVPTGSAVHVTDLSFDGRWV